MGWKIDYQKLLQYLQEKYGVSKAFYFGGVELHKFPYDYLTQETVPIDDLEAHLIRLASKEKEKLSDAGLTLLDRHMQRVRFYRKLAAFGYTLYLKPVKRYYEEDDTIRRKANCDVEMTLRLVQEVGNMERAVVLSGDGDFLPVLKYLKTQEKEVVVLARGVRTAREIRQFAGGNFRDFTRLETHVRREEK